MTRKGPEAAIQEVHITVPLVPGSVNHYVRHCIVRGQQRRFKTKEASAFLDAVAICAQGQTIRADEYSVSLTVYFAKGQKGDADNLAKLPLDGLVKAGVIHSDAAITDLHISKRRDRENPRTEIVVRAAQ